MFCGFARHGHRVIAILEKRFTAYN